MAFTITKFPDEPIIMLVHEGRQNAQETDQAGSELAPMLDAEPEPVFLVLDIRKLTIAFDDMPDAASQVSRGSDAPLHHPNIRESLLISTSGLVKLGAQGLRTATFGNVHIRVFETPEQAVAYCREQIAIANDQHTEGHR